MPMSAATALDASFFTARGADAQTAAALAAQHNALAGVRSADAPNAPLPPPAPLPQRLAQPKLAPSPVSGPTDGERASAEIAQIRQDRIDGKIDDYSWRTLYEPKLMQLSGISDSLNAYERGGPGDKARLQATWQADSVQQSFEDSIDASMVPAASPYEYNLPI